eukprot:337333-Rhodomonas_salina.1
MRLLHVDADACESLAPRNVTTVRAGIAPEHCDDDEHVCWDRACKERERRAMIRYDTQGTV